MTSPIIVPDRRTGDVRPRWGVRHRRLTPPALLVLALSLLVTGCKMPGKPDPKHRPKFPAQVSDFKVLFEENCTGCHGKDGKSGPAPPLNDPLFRGRAGISEDEIRKVVTNGRKGTSMPAFLKENGGALTKAQIDVLVYQIKGISYSVKDTGSGDKAAFETRLNPAGVELAWGQPKLPDGASPPPYHQTGGPGDKERGLKVFARACASCHGSDGKSDGKKQRAAEGTDEEPRGPNNKAFLTLTSDQALRRVIITGRPDLEMPNYADRKGRAEDFKPLESQEVADLVALLGYWRQGGSANGK